MAYDSLKETIKGVVRTNDMQAITGDNLQGTLTNMVDVIGGDVEALKENATSGVLVYSTYAELPPEGVVNSSYKVSNDSDSSKNGYYHWSGSVYVKDADLIDDTMNPISTGIGVSGKAVADYYKAENTDAVNPLSITGSSEIESLGGENLLDGATWVDGEYLRKDTGSTLVFGMYSYTSNYMSVDEQTRYIISTTVYHGGCFYDADYNFIGGFGVSDPEGAEDDFEFTTPANCAYIRVNYVTINIPTASVKKIVSKWTNDDFVSTQIKSTFDTADDVNTASMKAIQGQIDLAQQTDLVTDTMNPTSTGIGVSGKAVADYYKAENTDAVNPLSITGSVKVEGLSDVNLLESATWVNGEYLRKDTGSTLVFGMYSYTSNYMSVDEQTRYIISTTVYHGGCFYDADYNFIGGFGVSAPEGAEDDFEFTTPANCVYIRVNYATADIPSAWVKKVVSKWVNDDFVSTQIKSTFDTVDDINTASMKAIQGQIDLAQQADKQNQWLGKKIVWLGTSIPYGQFSDVNYPTIVAENLGCEMANTSMPWQAIHTAEDGSVLGGGSTSLSIAEYQSYGVSNPGNRSYENCLLGQDADLYVFDVEPNNTSSDLTDYELFDFNSWSYTDGSNFEDHRKTFLGALIFLLDKLYTEKPNARVVFMGEFSYVDPTTFGDEYLIKTNFMKYASEQNYHYIDISGKMQYNQKNKAQYFTTDWVHPNTYAHGIIANMLTNELKLVN